MSGQAAALTKSVTLASMAFGWWQGYGVIEMIS